MGKISTDVEFEKLIPPPSNQIYINDIGCVVMSLETLKAIVSEEISEHLELDRMERQLRQYGRLD